MSRKKVAIILINYHGITDTLECLDSLDRAESKNQLSVYVVNVDSSKVKKALDNHKIQPSVIELEDNLGFTGANNVGMEVAIKDGAEIVVLLNNDTTVDKDFLDPLVFAATQKGGGLVSPKIYFYPGNEFHRDSYKKSERGKVIWYAGGIIDWKNVYGYHRGVDEVDHGQFDETGETDFATGCCIVVSKITIDKVGMLDDKYFFSLEDLDWSMRVKQAGLKIIYQPESVIWHKNAGSSGGSGSKTHQYYHNRNRILFGQRYATVKTKLALFKEAFVKLRKGNEIEKRAIKDALINKYGGQHEG